MVTRGSYCLCVRVKEEAEIRVGAMGIICFPRGLYIYVGSAMNSLEPRLTRHLRTSRGEGRAVKWHIDYLLTNAGVEIEDIYSVEGVVRMECEMASRVAERGKAVPRFGCSDCQCPSHLYRVESWDFLEEMGLKKRDLWELLTSSPVRL